MNWNCLYYIIPALFILILVLPIFVEVRTSFNPLFNRGVVAIFVFKKQILYYIFSFHGKFIELQNETETQMQELKFDSPEFAVMEEFGRQIKEKIKLKKVYVFYNIGTGDAFGSAIFCGIINQFLTQAFLFLKSQKPTASFCVYDTVSYNRQVCEIAGVVQISISIFDVAYSYLHSLILTNKR